MKNKIIILSAFCCLSLVSCKKDFSCQCTITLEDPTGTGQNFALTQVTKIEKTTKKGAEGTCDNIKSSLGTTTLLLGAKVDCTID